MNIRQATALLGSAVLIWAPLAFSPQAEAKGGNRAHGPRYYEQHNHRRDPGVGYRRSDRRYHSGHYRGDGHGHHSRYRGYGYHYHPHEYCCDSSFVLGTYWPYGFSIYYLD